MKTKFILSIICLSLIGLVSCKKQGATPKEISEAVKDYFKLVKEINSIKHSNTNNGNKKNSQLKNEEPHACITFESGKTTFLPCSGMEGYTQSLTDPTTNAFIEIVSLCFLKNAPEVVLRNSCIEERIEIGTLMDGKKYLKSSGKLKRAGSNDLIFVKDIVYSEHEDIAFGEHVQYNNLEGAILKGSAKREKGMILYENTYTEPIICKYKYDPKGEDLKLKQIFVKGIEKVTYNRKGSIGEFSINYGNGELDYIATITENGNTYEINYKELQESMDNDLLN